MAKQPKINRDNYLHELKQVAQVEKALEKQLTKLRFRINKLLESAVDYIPERKNNGHR